MYPIFDWLLSRTSLLFRPPPPHKSPWRLSYLLRMFLQRPSSFRMSATSWRRAAFSRSRKAARTEIWFSLSRRASRERLAASLFLVRRFQYFSSCYQRRGGKWGRRDKKKRGMRRVSGAMMRDGMAGRKKGGNRSAVGKDWRSFPGRSSTPPT